MSSIALMSGAESLEAQILSLGETEPHKGFLIAHKLGKISEDLKKKFQPKAVEYWQANKELPAGYECKETNRTTYVYETDPKWQMLNGALKAREALLKQASDASVEVFDELGEVVPKVHKKETAVFAFSQK